MRRNLLQMLSGKCRHEFAWPRKTDQGEYYQVCLICGDEYQYDWPSMRRLGRRGESTPTPATASSDRGSKKSWVPRARRLRSPIRVGFRTQGETDLRNGTIENISQSGLFLRAETCPSEHEVLEMIFQMPVEISGQDNAEVMCMGQVVRVSPQAPAETAAGFAVTILDYHFLHRDSRKRTSNSFPQDLPGARQTES